MTSKDFFFFADAIIKMRVYDISKHNLFQGEVGDILNQKVSIVQENIVASRNKVNENAYDLLLIICASERRQQTILLYYPRISTKSETISKNGERGRQMLIRLGIPYTNPVILLLRSQKSDKETAVKRSVICNLEW